MRAMVLPRFGGPDLFGERGVERPSPGLGDGEADARLDTGHGRGKVVLRVAVGG